VTKNYKNDNSIFERQRSVPTVDSMFENKNEEEVKQMIPDSIETMKTQAKPIPVYLREWQSQCVPVPVPPVQLLLCHLWAQ
jgi:hypothetical protein